MKDVFVLVAPGYNDLPSRGVIRIEPEAYSKVAALSRRTGLSICRIVTQAIDFALDHMDEEVNNA